MTPLDDPNTNKKKNSISRGGSPTPATILLFLLTFSPATKRNVKDNRITPTLSN